MFPLIYVEREVKEHPRVKALLRRLKKEPVYIEKYGEVFNRKGQNFRLQKKAPSLILAGKRKNFLLPIPDGFGEQGYYFSHLYNCPFDCRYCFLQGMYRSANFVFFVNFEDFQEEIKKVGRVMIFTGYDCDSLALEGITGFATSFLPFIEKSEALFEFRTKSSMIAPFLKREALGNCVIAFTLTPEKVAREHELKTASLEGRLQAAQKLQKRGWPIGLRFDPVIHAEEYPQLFKRVFSVLDPEKLHSATLGPLRFPREMASRLIALYPEERLFLREEEPIQEVREELLAYLPGQKIYRCVS